MREFKRARGCAEPCLRAQEMVHARVRFDKIFNAFLELMVDIMVSRSRLC